MLIYCRSTSSPYSSPIYSSPLDLPSVDLLHFILTSPNLRENSHLKRKKKGSLSFSLSSTPNPPLPLSSLFLSSSLKTPLKSSTSILSASLFDFSQNPSPTPIYNDSDAKSKPRKRLIKKNTTVEESTPDFEIGEEENGDELGDFVRGESDYDDAFFPCATLLVNGLGRSIAKALDKQYADVLSPLKENLTPKNFGLKSVQKLTKRSVCPYVVPDELGILLNSMKRMLDILRSKIEHQLKSWGSCIPDRGSTTPGERLSEVTVMLRTKFRNYLQAVVEKLAGNLLYPSFNFHGW